MASITLRSPRSAACRRITGATPWAASTTTAFGGHLVQLLDEDGTFRLEVAHDVQVVDDLAPDVHGRAVALERALDDLDGAVDPGTERTRGGENDLVLAAGPSPPLERPAHREQGPEGPDAAEDRPALARVRDGADDRERVLRQRAHDPGGLHVDGHRAGVGQRLALAGPEVAGRGDERPGQHAEARPAELGGEEAHPREAPRLGGLGVAQFVGDDEVPRLELRREAARHADEGHRSLLVELRGELRPGPPGARGSHADDDVGATDRQRLDPERGEDLELSRSGLRSHSAPGPRPGTRAGRGGS